MTSLYSSTPSSSSSSSSSVVPSTYPRLRLGSLAPDFEADTTLGRIRFYDWIHGSWGILFSHPADFTPVCTTELGEAARRKEAFRKRNVRMVGLSVDGLEDHEDWVTDIEEVGRVHLDFPIIADKDRVISRLYHMLDTVDHDPANIGQGGVPMTVRSVFIVDPSHKIRLILTYPASCGRNFDEILRVIDSLQLTDKRQVVTPSDWKPGQPVLIHPSVSNEDAKIIFGDYQAIRPYYRLTQL
ncbi:1-Cys peroxiredoxin [Piptocephalis cylindrospora]|uniref:1-Cys peroxiredoxin n=1 Tax=Piptocephalis cylindrospora TaxID=1907219 RepID=A0A4V1IYN4_9FUNG|nr:1-Cys peroxiredoxin [Piptocephalis cylindrospora]|eukprot:RKP15169.1 1-Cys peroxiredoxin [Piptocephalis cylindrospora]